MPGDNVSITVKLINPIAMEEGLRFAIREGGRTVGAGVVAKILEEDVLRTEPAIPAHALRFAGLVSGRRFVGALRNRLPCHLVLSTWPPTAASFFQESSCKSKEFASVSRHLTTN